MNTDSVNTQKSSDKTWIDEGGIQVPYNRTTKSERLQEIQSARLMKKAIDINTKLKDFKEEVGVICKKVYDGFMIANNTTSKNSKGNFTWYNFDRSIKVEVSVNERIEFDDLGIKACKEKLDLFLEANLESKNEFIKQMVLDAFETSRGKLDSKKVMSLLKYKSKIKAPLFQDAMQLLENSIRRPSSKTYFRIWFKDAEGKYESIDLNFSSI